MTFSIEATRKIKIHTYLILYFHRQSYADLCRILEHLHLLQINLLRNSFSYPPPLKACSYKYSDSQLLWILCLQNKDRARCCLRLIVISLCVCFSRPCLEVQGGVVQEFFNSSIALKDPHRTEDVTMADRLPSLCEVHVQYPEHLRTHTHTQQQPKQTRMHP